LRYEREAAERAERKAKERDDKDAAKEKAALEKAQAKAKKNQPAKGKRIPFNFEAVSSTRLARLSKGSRRGEEKRH
jgi:phage terminase Nu1 subunit (DNA packaging protein)